MQVRSLGYLTDLIFVRFDGVVLDRGDYVVARSPLNPTYYWGNFLLFPEPPGPGDLERWSATFQKEFGGDPRVKHLAFGWDSEREPESGALQPFLSAGFERQSGVVLSARGLVPPPRPNREVVVRPLGTEEDWAQALEIEIELCPKGHDPRGYLEFVSARQQRQRRMVEAGLGHWFGAFLGEEMAGGLGIFRDGGLARYQTVSTRAPFRGKGIAGTLVYESGRQFQSVTGVDSLVIVAEEGSQALRIYESVGFVFSGKVLGLQRGPRSG